MSELGYAPPAESTPAEPAAEPSWSGPSQEEWGSVMGFIQQQQEAAQQQAAWEQQQAAQQQSPYAGFDPFAENAGEQLNAIVQQAIQQAVAPLTQWQYEQQLGEASDRAYDIIADDVSRNGEFMLGEKAYATVEAIANSYMQEMAARYGYGPQAAEAALAKAAADWRSYEAELREAAINQHMNQIATIGNASREPTVFTGAASQGSRVPPGGDEMSVVQAFGGVVPGRA